MARLEAEVTANISGFERALNQATEKAREFGEKTSEVGKDLFKEAAGHDLSQMLGIAGATAAVTAFGAAAVEAFKGSIEAAGHAQSQILKLQSSVKDPALAKQIHEWAENTAVTKEEVNDLEAAFIRIGKVGGTTVKEVTGILLDLQDISGQTGISITELGEAFEKAYAGGADAGEHAARLLKTIPGLAEQVRKQMAAKHIMGTPEEYVKSGQMTRSAMEKAIHAAAPVGYTEKREATLEGAEGKLGITLEKLEAAFGEGLLPIVQKFIGALNENLPKLEPELEKFGEEIGEQIMPALINFASGLHDNLPAIEDAIKELAKAVGTAANFIKDFLGPHPRMEEWGKKEEQAENQLFKGIWDMITKPGSPARESDRRISGNTLQEQKTTNNFLEAIAKSVAQVFQ